MTESNIQDPLMILDNETNQQEIKAELQHLDDLLVDLQQDNAVSGKTTEPTVRWRKRDKDGNEVYERPRSTRTPSQKAGHSQKNICTMTDSHCEVAFSPETVESFLQELQSSLNDVSSNTEASPPKAPLASLNWSTRKHLFSESWRAERPRLVNTLAAQTNVSAHTCQQCGRNPAVVRCRDCLPRPMLCDKCDVLMHTRYVFHNRDAMTAGFFQPLPPTTYVLNNTLCHDARLVPVEIPVKVCDCPAECLKIKPGKAVAVITINGRYDLSMPELRCEACRATWTVGVHDLNLNDFWPATLHFSTVYATDVFFSFEEMKMAAPGLSCQAFLKMLDQRTVRFGRTGSISADSFLKSFFEWEAVRFDIERILRNESFTCQACTPDMLAVSVDGNRKHYRFKNAAGSEEKAIFEDIFIAKDEDVGRFVDYIHKTTKHVSGRGVCGGEWSAARETSQRSSSKLDEEGLELAVCRHGVLLSALNMFRGEIFAYPLYLQQKLANSSITFFCTDVTCKYWPYLQRVTKSCPELQHLLKMKPFLSVFHAKAHDFRCEVKWSGAYQEGAGLTLGEEVEQCNAFLSRIAVTTKHMSKAGRTDMLTLMAMRWNQQKFDKLATSLARRYQKVTKALLSQLQNLESLKVELSVTESQLGDWVSDVKEWAEATTTSTRDAGALVGKIEVLVASIKRRSQRLYKDNDGNKARAKIRRKIREEKGILTLTVEKYNRMVPDTETLCLEEILSGGTAWPWQQPHSDSVSLSVKRRAFDSVMAVRRLEEEKKILVKEMDHHWKSLAAYDDTLKELSILFSSEPFKSTSGALTEEGLKGLQSIILRKRHNVKHIKLLARECYLRVLSGMENVNFDNASDNEFYSDSELSDESQ